MHIKKPAPLALRESKPPRTCPVCGTLSYSSGGVHPQCAQEQADAPRVARLRAAAKKAEKPKEKVDNLKALKAWHKLCPKCHTQLHLRKPVCQCGHQFA